ncbi:hypothetical protein [Streptomyces sp. NPDC058876]
MAGPGAITSAITIASTGDGWSGPIAALIAVGITVALVPVGHLLLADRMNMSAQSMAIMTRSAACSWPPSASSSCSAGSRPTSASAEPSPLRAVAGRRGIPASDRLDARGPAGERPPRPVRLVRVEVAM